MRIEILSTAVNPDIRDGIHTAGVRLVYGFEEEFPGSAAAVISAGIPGKHVP